MVHRTYYGLGPGDAPVREFEGLTPHVVEMLELRQECVPFSPDYMAMGIALDGLQTAAYHFTRRRHFYHPLEETARTRREGNGRLSDRREAMAAFEGLAPYNQQLHALMYRCRPFGRDYLALDVARLSLDTAAFHFTRVPAFYGSKSDSSGPVRPQP
jgi:hypothetical protein